MVCVCCPIDIYMGCIWDVYEMSVSFACFFTGSMHYYTVKYHMIWDKNNLCVKPTLAWAQIIISHVSLYNE